MRPSLRITSNTLGAQLAIAVHRAEEEWENTLIEVGVEALEFAKEQAPWVDRTGAAREGLDVDVDKSGNTMTLTMFHTVDYGQWLETIQNGRYAVIMPTLELYGEEYKRRIERG